MSVKTNNRIIASIDRILDKITDRALYLMQPHVTLAYGIVALLLLWIFLLFIPPPTLPLP